MLAPYLAQTEGAEQVEACFRFQINGTSDPNFLFPSNMAHVVSDVTRNAAGVFDVTFALGHRWPGLVAVGGSVMTASGAGLGLIVQSAVADYDASTGVLRVRTVDPYTDATPAALDPADDDWVCLRVVFQRRTQFSSTVAI